MLQQQQQHYYLKNEEEEKEKNNTHHHHVNATTDAIFMSYNLHLPGTDWSVVRCEVIYDKIGDEQDSMVFRNCVLMDGVRTVIDTYITLNPIIASGSSSSSSSSSYGVFKAALFSTKITRYDDSCGFRDRDSRTSLSHTFFVVKAVDDDDEENIPGSISKAREEVRRNMAAMEGGRHHRNLLRVKDCFMDKQSGKLCVVMPFPGQSLRTLMKMAFPGGFPEDLILSALRSVLDALGFLHTQSIFHTDINAGHVYLGNTFCHQYHSDLHFVFNEEINLGFAATVYDDDDDEMLYLPVATMSNWAAAPEVYNGNGYSDKADIWLLGITALELAIGGLKVPNRNALEAIINEIHDKKKLPDKNYYQQTQANNMINAEIHDKNNKLPIPIPIPGKNKNNNYEEEEEENQDQVNNMFKTAFKYYVRKLLQPFSSSNAADDDELLVPLCSSSPYDEESLTMMLPNCPSSSSNDNDNDNEDYYCSFSETFTDMVMKCLAWDPEKRPDFNELMSHNFFRQDWSRLDAYYFYEEVMKQWPSSS